MKQFKNTIRVVSVLIPLLFFFPIVSFGAFFTVEISGLPEPISEIQSFDIWLDVDDSFAFSDFTLGSAVPQSETGQPLGWDSEASIDNPLPGKFIFKAGGIDQDGAFMSNYFDLRNGVIYTFEYTGMILGLNQLLISNRIGINQMENLNLTYQLSESGLTISQVPVPSAILLLGSGLVSLVAVRRKRA